MNRFKFRVWRKDVQRMIYGVTYLNPLIDWNVNIFMQCTGAEDRDGRLIYEGDIVQDSDDIYVISYLQDLCQFIAKSTSNNTCRDIIDLHEEKIIGNIYENPLTVEIKYGITKDGIVYASVDGSYTKDEIEQIIKNRS